MALSLRHQICRFIESESEYYSRFLAETDEENLFTFTLKLRSPTYFSQTLDIRATADYLQLPISIISLNDSKEKLTSFEIVPRVQKSNKRLWICYSSGLELHSTRTYNSLQIITKLLKSFRLLSLKVIPRSFQLRSLNHYSNFPKNPLSRSPL
jgi:hypothetical protein